MFTLSEIEALCDVWGTRPGEYFVIRANYITGAYGLARSPGGAEERAAKLDDMTFPDGSVPFSTRYYPGELVRLL